MSSVECLREFVNQRLTAAAEEIFRVFKQTVDEYEEEISRQRRLLDIVWEPEIKLHRIEFPQQLCVQERSSSLDQEDPEPPQIKEEQEELCTSQEREQLVLKQETDAFMLTPADEESDHNEDQTLNLSPDKTIIAAEKESVVNIPVNVISEPKSDQQLLFHNSHVAENQDQKGVKSGDSGSTRNAELEPKNQHHKNHSNNGCSSTRSEIHWNTHTGKKPFECDTCGQGFKCKSALQRHRRIHTGEKPYLCKTCGKRFSDSTSWKRHIRIHTGEKPYLCKTCGKRFNYSTSLKRHIRIHTGEKPYNCKICGRDFRQSYNLTDHMRTHTGEKPYLRKTRFSDSAALKRHITIHTEEKPYTCNTCGRAFGQNSHLSRHMRRAHSAEKP